MKVKALRSPWKHYLYHTRLMHKFLILLMLQLVVEMAVSHFFFQNNARNLLTKEIQATSKQFMEQYTDNVDYRLTKSAGHADGHGNGRRADPPDPQQPVPLRSL